MLYEVITLIEQLILQLHFVVEFQLLVKVASGAGQFLFFGNYLAFHFAGSRITSYNVCYTKLLRLSLAVV